MLDDCEPRKYNHIASTHHFESVCGHYLSGGQRKAVPVHTQCGTNTKPEYRAKSTPRRTATTTEPRYIRPDELARQIFHKIN